MNREIHTARLNLIAVTTAMLQAELHDREYWCNMLNCDVTPDWPPEYWDETAMRYTIDHMLKTEDAIGWGPWYVLRRSDNSRNLLIGTAGLKGHPSPDGTIEIGYGIVPSCRGQGYATEASRGVIEWACRAANVSRIIAETYPHLQPSIRVMEKLGMKLLGDGSEPGVIRYGLPREQFAAAPALPGRSTPPAAPRSVPRRDSPGPR